MMMARIGPCCQGGWLRGCFMAFRHRATHANRDRDCRRSVRTTSLNFSLPLTSSGDTMPNCLGEFREIRESNERTSVAA